MRKTWYTCLPLAAGVLLGVGVTGCSSSTKSSPPIDHPSSQQPIFGQLISYDSCPGLLDALHARGRAVVGAYGFGGGGYVHPGVAYPASATPERAAAKSSSGSATSGTAGGDLAASAPLSHSSTNTQEADVDEPDLVKTDGRYMISLDGQRLRLVDVRTQKLRATLALPHPGSELLLAGDRVVVLSGESAAGPGPLAPVGFRGGISTSGYLGYATPGQTTATIVDITNPDAPSVARSYTFDAGEVAARVVGGTIRLVLTSPPPTATWATPRDSSAAEVARATKANQSLVDATPLDSWLPHWTIDGSPETHQVSACSAVATPAKPNGVGLVTLLSLDPKATSPGAGTSVFGAGDTAYAEGKHLYVSDTSYDNPTVGTTTSNGTTSSDGGPTSSGANGGGVSSSGASGGSAGGTGPSGAVYRPPTPTLHLMEFDLTDPAQARYLASGDVKGMLHDSYSLSEYQDHLRVTTTTYDENGATTTGISVLERRGDKLVQVGHVGGLGTGEQVYAVRYIADRGYVVTFRQIDPLHVVDLSNPAAPVLKGTVELPGYSSLLLALPDHQLLGIGQSVTGPMSVPACPPNAACPDLGIVEPNGLQLSLFDVSDAAHPRLLDKRVLSQAYESVANDPHAVTIDQQLGLIAIPSTSGLLGIRVESDKLAVTTAAFTVPYSVQANRTVIAGDRLFELSDRGVAVRALPGLKQTGWIAF